MILSISDLAPTQSSLPPIRPLPLPQRLQVAVEAEAVVTGDHAAAFRTSPLPFLSLEKSLDALVSYAVQVLYLAHPELCSVPLIDSRERLAGKGRALIAVFDLVLPKQAALLLQECAGFVPGPASHAIHHPEALALDVVREGKIRSAHIAVHAARGHQLFLHTSLSRRSRAIKSSSSMAFYGAWRLDEWRLGVHGAGCTHVLRTDSDPQSQLPGNEIRVWEKTK